MAEILNINDYDEIKNSDKDVLSALLFVSEFWDVHCCAIVKNEIPIGVALSGNPYDAKIKAIDCNPVEALGATIAFSKEIDKNTAQSLSKMNFKTVISTEIKPDAKKYLEKCQSKIIEIKFRLDLYKKNLNENSDTNLTPKSFKVSTKLKPTQEQVEDMVFAWKVLKSVKTDAVVIAKDFKTRAIVQGFGMEKIESAMDKACDGSKEAILAVSKNINSKELLHPAIQGRITGIIEPSDFKNDEIIKMAEKYGITVITVGAQDE